MPDNDFVQDPPDGRLDRLRVQLAVRHVRSMGRGATLNRDVAYAILAEWDQGDELSADEIKAVLRRFDL